MTILIFKTLDNKIILMYDNWKYTNNDKLIENENIFYIN